MIDERSADGEIVGTAKRFADGGKGFIKGGKRGLIAPVLPLDAYDGASPDEPILVCEGASDVGAAWSLNYVAVGVPAAGKCADELARVVEGRHVVLCRDRDGGAGARGTKTLAEAIVKTAESVRVIDPPGDAKDVRAAVVAGATRADFEALIRTAPLWGDEPEAKADDDGPGAPVLVRVCDVKPVEVPWLWPGRIPLGRITVLAGRPGAAKSFITMDWAARISRGVAWPDGAPCDTGDVLVIACEDGIEDTICPRLIACGADTSRVEVMAGVHGRDAKGAPVKVGFTLENLDPLRRAMAAGNYKAVILDPIGSYFGGKADSYKDTETRAVLAPLAQLAADTGAAVILVAHTNKGSAANPDDAVMGSRAFTGLARSVLHAIEDTDAPGRRLLAPGKCNISAPSNVLAFTISGDGSGARVVYDANPVNESAAEIFARLRPNAGGGGETVGADVRRWLTEVLSDGPKAADWLYTEAEAAGYSKSTLKRAKKVMKVEAVKEGFSGGWVWALPEGAHEGAHPRDVRPFGPFVTPFDGARADTPPGPVNSRLLIG